MSTPAEAAPLPKDADGDPPSGHFNYGSVTIECKGAFNWRLVTKEETGLTSNPEYLNSYGTEFAGLRSAVRFLIKNRLHHKRITLYCDSQACVDILQNRESSGDDMAELEMAESDIITSIKSYIPRFADITLKWVKGH